MPELPDALYAQIRALCEQGDELEEEDQFAESIACFQKAWQLLPEPRWSWDAGLWILGALGDVYFLNEDFAEAATALREAMQHYPEAPDNPFLCLRLGQCLAELGELEEARQWLTSALETEGEEIFEGEDPRYLDLARDGTFPEFDETESD
ncbi:tetratricopeptide repeat protein [Tuwongella immobilis]|uniref:Uncharacterized protein n=1 Tax=Tuwongella immobilis TaxID=692036 RepID=A0A6C2YUZ5_9BACT|nr:tetratricopeptide repeat protein [Tuwongella immobilis]VIP05558.1 tetratricopeptide repeat protein : Tetratricopeptide repeat protein OS=Eikenella corrodens ATCC 23834 GN=EIKCOROL_02646 PE=4 SV=1: TPR_2: TPR_19 [Tuwongella immobilis]VTS08472.1 tetratricopeptide repeat protein : Tetratricopeptide repeat protein OS=Eikenella corrodens ATCC 23834 GN=EIKCOROL_02646 PE=4 SV=1: TPR_2: TPR_19 [Tuwongella immobilis]